MWLRDFEPSSKVTTQQAGRLMIIETCFLALHCTHHGPGICDAESGCTECGTTFCNYTVVGTADDPFPTTPGGGDGGPGGGGGCDDCVPGGWPPSGPNVPENPCGSGNNASSVFYRPASGCGGGGTLPEIDDPFEKTKNIVNSTKAKPAIDTLKAQSSLGGERGYKFKTDGTPTTIINGAAHSIKFGDKTGYAGGYHNHTPTGIPMLSPPDVEQLLQFALAQGNYGNPGNAFIGMVAPNGMHYVATFNGNYNDALVSFSQQQLDVFVKDYETRNSLYNSSSGNEGLEQLFFKTLKDMNLIGKVSLQRVESNGTVKTIIRNSDGTTTAVPCP